MKRRSLLISAAAATTVFGLGISGARAAELTPVSVILNFSPYGLHVGPVMAKLNGLYEAAGLDVDIIRGMGSGESIKRVALGSTTFGLADASAVALGRDKGMMTRQVATILDDAGYVIYYRKGIGIDKPADLMGHSLGASADQAVYKIFPVYAKAAGFDSSKVNFVNMSVPTVIPSFVAGKIDAMLTFTTEEPNVISAAKAAGVEWGRFLYKDSGINGYSVGIIASDARIAAEPAIVEKFVNATMQGYAQAIADPAAAADAFVKLYPEKDRDLTLQQWMASMPLLYTDTARKKGLGMITDEKMKATLDLLKTFASVDKVSAEDLYDMKFLKPIFVKK